MLGHSKIEDCSFRAMKDDFSVLYASIRELFVDFKQFREYKGVKMREWVFWPFYIITLFSMVFCFVGIAIASFVTCAFLIIRYHVCFDCCPVYCFNPSVKMAIGLG